MSLPHTYSSRLLADNAGGWSGLMKIYEAKGAGTNVEKIKEAATKGFTS